MISLDQTHLHIDVKVVNSITFYFFYSQLAVQKAGNLSTSVSLKEEFHSRS